MEEVRRLNVLIDVNMLLDVLLDVWPELGDLARTHGRLGDARPSE